MPLQPNERSYNFVKAINFTLPWETGRDRNGNLRADGGLHYRDGGLPTKYGIWQGANPDLDVANLTLDQALDRYKKNYWDWYYVDQPSNLAANLNAMEIGAAVAMFDCGVNLGVKFAQGALYKAIQAKAKDYAKVITELRAAKYFNLRSQDFKKYGPNYNGWMNRINDLKKYVDVIRLDVQQRGSS